MEVHWGDKIESNHANGCMLSDVDWEIMIQVFSFTWTKLTIMESHRTSSPQDYGEDYHKETFPALDYGEDHLKGSNMLLQQKSAQMGNNLTEQQMNNNNKAKTKQQTQEQLSSPLSQLLKTYYFGNGENLELNTEIIWIYHQLPFSFVPCVEIYTKEPPSSCRVMYLIVTWIQSPMKEIFHFKWGLIGNLVGYVSSHQLGMKA